LPDIGVNYLTDLARSADFKEVVALYRAAGLSLTKDLLTLNSAPRVKASPNAEAYLVKNIAFNGRISVPVLTMHTTGDGLVVPENEQAYRSAVDQAGRANLLRQVFVHRAGHCAFTRPRRSLRCRRWRTAWPPGGGTCPARPR
jgi:dienelactone hydrolase